MNRVLVLYLFLAVALGAGCGPERPEPEPAPAPAGEGRKVEENLPEGTITVGSVSSTIKDDVEEFQPFVNYLASRLRAYGIGRGRVRVVPSIEEMAGLIRSGEVDLYMDSPFPVARVRQLTGVQPMLRRWKRGKGEYHSVIFVRADSGIESPADLRGKLIAFEDAASTSGYLLPKAALIQMGVPLNPYAGFEALVHPDSVGYTFSGDDESTFFWLMKGRAAAGAIDNISFTRMAGSRVDAFRVLYRSIDVPRQVVACRKDLEAGLAAGIREALVAMTETEEGRTVLAKFQQTARFDAFPQGPEAAFEPIEALLRGMEARDEM